MNFIEACKVMKNGTKVRLPYWPASNYYHCIPDTYSIVDHLGNVVPVCITEILNEAWYIYEEKTTAVVDNTKRVVRFKENQCERSCDNYIGRSIDDNFTPICVLTPHTYVYAVMDDPLQRSSACIEKFGTGEVR